MRLWGWWRIDPNHSECVNVHDTTTQGLIREAEFAEQANRGSKILRVSGQERNRPTQRMSAIVERGRS